MEIIKIYHQDIFHVIFDMNYIIYLRKFHFDVVQDNEIGFESHFQINNERVLQMNQLNNKDVCYYDLLNQHER